MKLRDLINSKQVPVPAGESLPELRKARKRVSTMSTHDLLAWADSAGSGMAKAFDDYRKDPQMISLDEIRSGLVALTAVTDELTAREDASQ